MRSSAASSTGSEARAIGVDRRDRGQATVELALALPFVTLLLLLVVQVLAVARVQTAVDQAAREGGRLAAVGAPPAAVRDAALAGGLPPGRTRVEVSDAGAGVVTVVVRTREPTDIPAVGFLVPDVELESTATFRREGDGARPG